MEDQVHIPVGVVASAIIGTAIALVGWIIRAAMGETLRNLRASIEANVKATDRLTDVMDKLADHQTDHEKRIAALEGRQT